MVRKETTKDRAGECEEQGLGPEPRTTGEQAPGRPLWGVGESLLDKGNSMSQGSVVSARAVCLGNGRYQCLAGWYVEVGTRVVKGRDWRLNSIC